MEFYWPKTRDKKIIEQNTSWLHFQRTFKALGFLCKQKIRQMALMTKLILGTTNWTTAQETLWPHMFSNALVLKRLEHWF